MRWTSHAERALPHAWRAEVLGREPLKGLRPSVAPGPFTASTHAALSSNDAKRGLAADSFAQLLNHLRA